MSGIMKLGMKNVEIKYFKRKSLKMKSKLWEGIKI